ncbi:MFS transporter [Streptomyces sp. MST-110588]|uniref:MFS transporter n=1 Tax=Streptomyces sp. MST-110588 TaxID=2833628 RepID=UPI001F5D5E6F|nr:MFS transporter [Streptomyces sp. MST-110588]
MVAVAAATFTVVTSEMLPVGLLTPMRDALGVTDGMAGMTLTVTGLVAALAAPALTLAVGRLDRRLVLCGLMTLLAVANTVAAAAPDFPVMLVARVLVGLSMGGVWALGSGLAVRLVPQRSVGSATALVFSGVAVASVLGVPAGTLMGELGGWRSAFVAVGVLAGAVAAGLSLLLPPLPAETPVRLSGVLALLRDVRVRTGLVVVALLVTGHFAAYTYVRPVLETLTGAGAELISTLLLVYGLAGIAGNFMGGAGAVRSPRGALLVISGVLAGTVLLVPVLGVGVPGAVALLVIWGLAYGGVSVSTQSWLTAAAPGARETASALFVAVFNAAISAGALAGGRAADGWGAVGVMWLGGALALGALLAVSVGKAPATERCE